jgi:anti-anti-sigma factor
MGTRLDIVEHSSNRSHVALVGRLDTAGVDAIELTFNAAVVARRVDAIVDLAGVAFLSSMGVRMLLTAAKALGRSGARLVLVAPGPLVAEALRHSALDEIVPVERDALSAAAFLTRVSG